MVALLSVPATQGPPEEMDFELHKLHIAVFPLRVNLTTTFYMVGILDLGIIFAMMQGKYFLKSFTKN